jgi:hypothetical protein
MRILKKKKFLFASLPIIILKIDGAQGVSRTFFGSLTNFQEFILFVTLGCNSMDRIDTVAFTSSPPAVCVVIYSKGGGGK